MNRVLIMGRLVKDAEVRTSGDTTVARTTIAVDRRYSSQEQKTDFISLVAFNKKAEFLDKYGKKGTKFVIEGEWRTGSYTDKDGNKVYTNDCQINEIEFAESKKDGTAAAPEKKDDDFMDVTPDMTDSMPF